MLKALYTAATGMKSQQSHVDVIANNLANVNTTGFKRSQTDFEDLMYIIQQSPGSATSQQSRSPTGIQVGSGSRLVSTTKVFSQGVLEPTFRDLDVAIQGNGFFRVVMPDGSNGYSRDGALRRDAQGNLVTPQGFALADQVTIPDDASTISIGADGSVSYTDAQGNQQLAGQLNLTRFANPSGLRSGGGNLFFETQSSGQAQDNVPGQQGAGTLLQGNLERSNVEVVTELVNLIVAQRAYEVNSRAIRSGDEMLSTATTLTR
ncbi:MAG: flagellar basal-body rod protein FlgG [Planctomycetota bacterium]